MKQEIIIRSIKIIDIIYITIIYFLSGYFIGAWVDLWMGSFDQEEADKKSTIRLMLEVLLQVSLFVVLMYIIRNLAEIIPFPLDNIAGFNHGKVKELKNAWGFTFPFLFFQTHLKDKLTYLHVRMFRGIKKHSRDLADE